MIVEELQRVRTELVRAKCDFALLSSLHNVTYASGYEVPVPLGAVAEWSFSGALALVGAQGSWLLTPNAATATATATAQSWLDNHVEFAIFDSFVPVDGRAAFIQAVRETLVAAGLQNSLATIGVEGRTMPHAVSELLAREFPNLRLIEVDGALQNARLVKTEREIALLRAAAAIGDVGHNVLAELCRSAGQDECAMWGQITAAMNHAAGTEITVTGELVTGPRTSVVLYPNGPKPRITAAGDAALMDISGRVGGYWFDCSNTHVIGAAATPHQRKYAKASQAACDAAMSALRPGARARDAAEAARAAFEKHGLPVAHYSGHQIGVTVNELPRLVPYDDTLIEAGMVFSVEPGAYQGEGGNFGARSEKIVLVTPSGPEILSQFHWGID